MSKPIYAKGDVIDPDPVDYPGCVHVDFGSAGDLYFDDDSVLIADAISPELRAAICRALALIDVANRWRATAHGDRHADAMVGIAAGNITDDDMALLKAAAS